MMEQMSLASEPRIPPMRPLFFDYPDRKALYETDDEFLFGPDIVVARVVHPGARGAASRGRRVERQPCCLG